MKRSSYIIIVMASLMKGCLYAIIGIMMVVAIAFLLSGCSINRKVSREAQRTETVASGLTAIESTHQETTDVNAWIRQYMTKARIHIEIYDTDKPIDADTGTRPAVASIDIDHTSQATTAAIDSTHQETATEGAVGAHVEGSSTEWDKYQERTRTHVTWEMYALVCALLLSLVFIIKRTGK